MNKAAMRTKKDYYYIVIAITVAAMLAFYGVYALPTFQTDTYAKWFYSQNGYIEQCFSTARYGEALYVWLSFHTSGNPVQHGFTHVAIACFINCVITVYIWHVFAGRLKIYEEEGKETLKAALILGVICLRANVFNSDIFQYGYDAAVTFLGDAFAISAAVIVSKKGNYKRYLLACIMSIISVTFRQTCLFWFVIMSVLLYYMDYLAKKEYSCFREIIKRIGVYLSGGLFSVLCIKVFVPGSVRGSLDRVDLHATWTNLRGVIKALFFDCLGIMPKYFYTVLLLIMGSLLLFYTLTAKWDKNRWGLLLNSSISLIGIFLATFITAIFDTWLPHRVLVGFITWLPVLIIMSVGVLAKEQSTSRIRCFAISVPIMLFFMFISWYFTMNIFRGQVITNAVDQRDAQFYYEQIREYENLTGCEVKNVAYKRDENYTEVLPGVIAAKSINERAFSTPWAQREIIRLLEGKILRVVPFDDHIYDSWFYGKDWETLSNEQVKCVGDTAYIMLY
ncbi:glucosyltransferase domain-containing protein [Enterocloster lavalensis]|uniref:glucosyltransferase domain-containing protein n=1 Tax=Enterocloster lavalensis TaxID=460384 RepID=UPI0026652966|nr:glucosyltransferase domain-containing protein [Enterocloster lavalensis]